MGSGTAQGAAPAQNMMYGAPGAAPNTVSSPPVTYGAQPMAPGGSGTFAGTCAQGAAPAQNMMSGARGVSPNPVSSPPVTYGAPPMSPPGGSGTFGQGVAMGSGTFAQGAVSSSNMTFEALSAAPSPVSSPVTYAAPP